MTRFLLLHGGGMGGWVWRYIAGPLRAAGHDVHTPTFTGFGERAHLTGRNITCATHVADVMGIIEHEELTDVVLVAHSYAGSVAPGIVAAAGERIARVIYIDAIVPRDGESVVEAMGYMTSAQARETAAMLSRGEGPVGAGVPAQVRAMANAGPQRMSPERDAWVFRHLTDMPLSCNVNPVVAGADSIDVPVTYLAAPLTMMQSMHKRAAALGWTVHQLGGDRDHMVHVGDPESVLPYLYGATSESDSGHER
jgi:pimeloyl-ACP methyl ester carboxylesterase